MTGKEMELGKLYYFYVVAQYQHVTRAAEQLHIAQPALTKAIKRLEDELGVPLFFKYKRNIRLTEFGEYLKEKLDQVFGVLEQIPEELEMMREQSKKTIHLNVLAASTIVTEAIVQYKKKNEHVIFQVIQNEENIQCDISVTTNAVDFSRLPAFEKRCIVEEKIFLAAPQSGEYARRSWIDLEEVKNREFVNLAGSRLFRIICDKFCLSAGFHPNIVFESDSPMAVKNLISAGVGIGFWPAFSWGKAPGDIVLLPIRTPNCQRELILGLHHGRMLSDAAVEFYEYLIEFIKKQRMKSEQNMDGHWE